MLSRMLWSLRQHQESARYVGAWLALLRPTAVVIPRWPFSQLDGMMHKLKLCWVICSHMFSFFNQCQCHVAKTVVPDIETCRPLVAKESARVLSRRVWLSCHKRVSLHRASSERHKIEAYYAYWSRWFLQRLPPLSQAGRLAWDLLGLLLILCRTKKSNACEKTAQCNKKSATKNGQSRRVVTSQFATKPSNDLHRQLHTSVKTRMVFRHDISGVSINRGTPKWMVYKGKSCQDGWWYRGIPISGPPPYIYINNIYI